MMYVEYFILYVENNWGYQFELMYNLQWMYAGNAETHRSIQY